MNAPRTDKTADKATAKTTNATVGSMRVQRGLAEMLKGGVIMDVVTPGQAKIAEDAGAVAVMALERVPADIRRDGGVARMSDPEMIEGIKAAVSSLEVSALEVPASFMTLRSSKRKYPTPSPPMGGDAAPTVVAAPDPPPGPPPDTTLADPKHFAHRLFSHGPSSSRGLTHADVRRIYGGSEYPGDSDGPQFDGDDAQNSDAYSRD